MANSYFDRLELEELPKPKRYSHLSAGGPIGPGLDRTGEPKEWLLEFLNLPYDTWRLVRFSDWELVKYLMFVEKHHGFVHCEHNYEGDSLRVTLNRGDWLVPRIYSWHQIDKPGDFQIVPWLTGVMYHGMVGHCPYCGTLLTHENVLGHVGAKCLFYPSRTSFKELAATTSGFYHRGRSIGVGDVDSGTLVYCASHVWSGLGKAVKSEHVPDWTPAVAVCNEPIERTELWQIPAEVPIGTLINIYSEQEVETGMAYLYSKIDVRDTYFVGCPQSYLQDKSARERLLSILKNAGVNCPSSL